MTEPRASEIVIAVDDVAPPRGSVAVRREIPARTTVTVFEGWLGLLSALSDALSPQEHQGKGGRDEDP